MLYAVDLNILAKLRETPLHKTKHKAKAMTQENIMMAVSVVADESIDASTYGSSHSPPSCKRMKLEDSKKRWTNEEVTRLIELFEERTILWNVFDKEYCKRDKLERDVAFNDISKELNTPILDIKAKLNTLRAQMGRELKKVKSKPKSGQPIDELYQSSWVYWKRLQFLAPVMMQTAKTRLDPTGSVQNNNNSDDSIFSEDELATMITQPKIEKTISESDDDVINMHEHHSTINDVTTISRRPPSITGRTSTSSSIASPTPSTTKTPITTKISAPPPPTSIPSAEVPKRTVSHFAAYIDEKLASFDRRNRTIAEKRITDILFEMEMNSTTPETNCACSHCQQNAEELNIPNDTTYTTYRS